MKKAFFIAIMLTSSACQTYKYADKVKMIAFDDNFTTGKSIGNVRGEDCQMIVFGYPLSAPPTLDKAIENVQQQMKSGAADSFTGGKKDVGLAMRYLNDVSTENEGFNAGLFAKNCIVVKGRGYK